MKLSDKYAVDKLYTQRSDVLSKLYAVENIDRGFGISFNGTGEGGEAKDVAAAALVPFYRAKVVAIDAELRGLGVNPDD